MDKDIKIAEENLEYLSSDPETQELYFERERALHEKANLINTGIRKGREEGLKEGKELGLKQGIAQGVEQGKIESAKNLLPILDDETIATTLGLDIELVKSLRNEQ